MTTMQLLDDLLHELSDEQRAEFKSNYGRIQKLPSSDLPLQEFLDEFLRQTVTLFSASAGLIWFRSPDSQDFQLNTRLGFDRLGLVDELAGKHRDLVAFAFNQRTPFVVNPYSAPQSRASVSNPTDSFVVFGPVVLRRETISVVELFLGPTPIRGKTPSERERYRLWLDHLLTFFCTGVERRFLARSAPLSPALAGLEDARAAIAEHQVEIRRGIETTLRQFAGWNFGSLKDNQAFAKQVHQLLDENGLRVRCAECGSPAILRCQSAGNSKTGVFLYDHYLDGGRTFHGGPTTFPPITLIAKPPRRDRADKP